VPIKEVLEQFCEDTKASHEDHEFAADEVVVTRGHPVTEILEQAEKRKCDLIVMGTHGHGVLEDVLMGSTAQRVIRRSQIPVLVVRLSED
jgi:nucleotide-binding universal stress UspA family protein